MSVCVGDNVRFLNDVGGGKVTRIKGKVAYVLIDQGFEIPVNVSELVIVSKEKLTSPEPTPSAEKAPVNDLQISYNYIEREEVEYEEDEEIEEPVSMQEEVIENKNQDFYLAFVTESNSKSGENGVKLYLINDSDFHILYSIGIFENGSHALLDAGTLEPQLKVFISDISKESYPGLQGFSCQCLKFKKGIYNTEDVIDEELKIKSFKLLTSNTFKENDYFDFPAWILPLNSLRTIEEKYIPEKEIILKVVQEKEKKEKDRSKLFKKRPEPLLVEVDLHIQELIDDYRGMSNAEMLNLQLSKFASELESAISDKVHRIVFIHGVGNGTLKMALRKQLDELYSHLQYQDASYKEYGYGATMVILRR